MAAITNLVHNPAPFLKYAIESKDFKIFSTYDPIPYIYCHDPRARLLTLG